MKLNTNFTSMQKTAFTSSLNLNNKGSLFVDNSTKSNTNLINTSSNLNLKNNYLLTKSNYVSNIVSSINNSNHNHISYNSYLKSENLHLLNESSELISPKNTFGTQNPFISTNRKLKDFVNLYTKKKFIKNPKFSVKAKDNNLGYAGNINNKINGNIHANNIKGSSYFLSENILKNDSENIFSRQNNKQITNNARFKSFKNGSKQILDFE